MGGAADSLGGDTGVMGPFVSRVRAAFQDPNVKLIVGSAIVGTAGLGSAGGVIGLGTGSVIGMAAGILPAFFTFGLSIPIGAVAGGAIGLSSGVMVGAGVGSVGGGAAGYAWAYPNRVKNGVRITKDRLCGAVGYEHAPSSA